MPGPERVHADIGNTFREGVRPAHETPGMVKPYWGPVAPEGAIPWDQDLPWDDPEVWDGCQAKTAAGKWCKAAQVVGQDKCIFHIKQEQKANDDAGRDSDAG